MNEGNTRLCILLGIAWATISTLRAAGAHSGLYIGALADRQHRSFLLHASESSRVGREGRDGLRVLLVAVPRAIPGGAVCSHATYSRKYHGAGDCRFQSGVSS